MRFIDSYEAVLLDQGRTFMFENDRFGEGADFYSTYLDLGGKRLGPIELASLVGKLFDHMLAVGRRPARYDRFPTVGEAMVEIGLADRCDPSEIELISQLIARHELGSISEEHVAALLSLAETHRLAIVSNVWGPSVFFEENLQRHGIRELFEATVWSSDYGAIKPSRMLFKQALDELRLPAGKAVFVGDNPMRDVDAAKSLGCGAVWINGDGVAFPAGLRLPDLVVRDLGELAAGEEVGPGEFLA